MKRLILIVFSITFLAVTAGFMSVQPTADDQSDITVETVITVQSCELCSTSVFTTHKPMRLDNGRLRIETSDGNTVTLSDDASIVNIAKRKSKVIRPQKNV